MTITNFEFLEEYDDHSSPIYEAITRELEEEIKASLKTPENMNQEYNVKIMNLT